MKGMSFINEGLEILNLVDKAKNAKLYKELGEWVTKVDDLEKMKDALGKRVVELTEQLRFKGKVQRIAGHTFVEGDNEEVCSRCASIDHTPVYLIDMDADGRGKKATCPQCKTGNGTHFPPMSRKKAEQKALRQAAS
jgi:hypothetical protein